MCTSLAMNMKMKINQDQNKECFYFGRNMDLEYHFGERVVITPKYFPFRFRHMQAMLHHYAMIGMATVIDGYPLYAEAANEKGLCLAGLNFPGYAHYSSQLEPGKVNLAPFELIPWLLGRCSTLQEAKEAVKELHLVHTNFSPAVPLTPLHWHIADCSGSVILESTREGMRVYDNPFGVLTNQPSFDFHLANLSHYRNLTPRAPQGTLAKGAGGTVGGNGWGGIGLPGDFSSTSRWVKEVFLREVSLSDESPQGNLMQFFHLLQAVAVVEGSVLTAEEKVSKTTYSCCIQADRGIYYYTTYENCGICAVDMYRAPLDSNELIQYPLQKKLQIQRQN